ncbi:M28 family peptidase, partial [Pirellulales bacterium]|nr:M28 family peptidase [Pirellulales bacterium]
MRRPLRYLLLFCACGASWLGSWPILADEGPSRFSGKLAFDYLETLCAMGPRYSGSPGMARQQKHLVQFFTAAGGKVQLQEFGNQVRKRNPVTGKPAAMANLIVELHPEAKRRILLCAHYDTRPRPDRDPNPQQRVGGEFLGANDGASGTALLMEMARHVSGPGQLGVDLVLFDAEEFVWDERLDKYFLGSEHFARQYRDQPPDYRYEFGVLVDMVGDKRLNLLQERYSMSWEATRPLVKEIWATAARLRVREFIDRPLPGPVLDDHIPLNRIAKIPVCNIIDFQYPNPRNSHWHTTADAPANCSAKSLGKVGWVLQTWLAEKRRIAP